MNWYKTGKSLATLDNGSSEIKWASQNPIAQMFHDSTHEELFVRFFSLPTKLYRYENVSEYLYLKMRALARHQNYPKMLEMLRVLGQRSKQLSVPPSPSPSTPSTPPKTESTLF